MYRMGFSLHVFLSCVLPVSLSFTLTLRPPLSLPVCYSIVLTTSCLSLHFHLRCMPLFSPSHTLYDIPYKYWLLQCMDRSLGRSFITDKCSQRWIFPRPSKLWRKFIKQLHCGHATGTWNGNEPKLHGWRWCPHSAFVDFLKEKKPQLLLSDTVSQYILLSCSILMIQIVGKAQAEHFVLPGLVSACHSSHWMDLKCTMFCSVYPSSAALHGAWKMRPAKMG